MRRFLGRQLNALRLKQGLSLAVLAEVCDVPKSLPGLWEGGEGEPTYDQAVLLARALQVNAAELFTWSDEELARQSPDALLQVIEELKRLVQSVSFDERQAGRSQGRRFSGQRLRRARELGKWTQQALAEAMGLNRMTLIRWERDERSPDSDRVLELARLLEKHASWFYVPAQEMVGSYAEVSRGEWERLVRECYEQNLCSEKLAERTGMDADEVRAVLQGEMSGQLSFHRLRRAISGSDTPRELAINDVRVRAQLYELSEAVEAMRLTEADEEVYVDGAFVTKEGQ